MKNIPIPLHTSYKLQLIDKIETVIKRMRWKAHFFLDEKKKKERKKLNVKLLDSNRDQLKKLDNFEKNLFNVVTSLKFRKLNDHFQEKMKSNIFDESSTNVLMFADKIGNVYKEAPQKYKKLLEYNITKHDKKSTNPLQKAINVEAKNTEKII